MTIEKPPLVTRLKDRYSHIRKRSTDEGVLLREVWRIGTDQRIFGTISKRRGGSVLLDASGSMHLSPDDILSIVDSAPAVCVAVYAGARTYNCGVLRELVRNTMCVARSQIRSPSDGANIIDGPALKEWLAVQAEPRVWVSDGHVTGINERQSAHHVAEVMHTCRKHNIIRVGNVPEALKLFRRLETGRFRPHPAILRQKTKLTVGV